MAPVQGANEAGEASPTPPSKDAWGSFSCCRTSALLWRLWHPWAVGRPPLLPDSDLIERMSARGRRAGDPTARVCKAVGVCAPEDNRSTSDGAASVLEIRVVLRSVSQVDLVPLGVAAVMMLQPGNRGGDSARPCPHTLPAS